MAAESHSTTARTSHSTNQSGGWSTNKIATVALLSAVALVLSFIQIPVFPPAPYLTYDPSGVVALFAGLALGPAMGTAVSILPWVLHLIFQFNPWGDLMAIIATLALTLPAAVIYARNKTPRGLVAGMVVGGVVALVACIVGNLLITPIYSGVTVDMVVSMIVPILLPFNLIKIVLNCVITALVMKPLSKAIGS